MMVEQFVKNTAELNLLAQNFRDYGEIERLKELADQWLVPEEDLKDFLNGTRIRLAEIPLEETDFSSAAEKLAAEQYQLAGNTVLIVISRYLLTHLEEKGLEGKILQRHKSLEKCLNYILKQAYEQEKESIQKERQAANGPKNDQTFQGAILVFEDDKVFRWAEEYYHLDEKEAEEKRKKEWEKAERKRRKQAAERKKNMQEGMAVAASTAKKESDGQISLFDIGKQDEEKNGNASDSAEEVEKNAGI